MKNKSKGLGDTFSKITKALGIEECEECMKRKEAWNKRFPYNKVNENTPQTKEKDT